MLLEIHQLAKEEVYRGWVRIPEQFRKDVNGQPIREASIIEVTRGKLRLLAIVRGDNESTSSTIRLDETSRRNLGIDTNEIGTSIDLSLKEAGFLKRTCFYWNHPEPSNRFAMRLALISFVLGMVGLILGIIPIVCAK